MIINKNLQCKNMHISKDLLRTLRILATFAILLFKYQILKILIFLPIEINSIVNQFI